MPLALSVHNFITSVGADAGFAAIIGLAILILLYFAHARETANIRREAEELSDRLAQAESRLALLSRQPASAASPAPAPAPQTGRPAPSPLRAVHTGASPVPAPGAPAGVAAPALAAATHVVPVASPPAPSGGQAAVGEPAEPEVPAAAEPALDEQGEEVLAGQGARAMAASAPVRERSARPVGPSPATAAGGANGGGGNARAAAPAGVRQAPPPRERVPARSGAAPAQARRASLPPRPPARRQRGTGGRRFALLIGALIAVGAIAVLVIVTQSGGSSGSLARQASTSNSPGPTPRRGTPPFTPSSVQVSVLNGTATNELAHRVAAKLTGAGYKQGTVATASTQTQSATVVAYLPGFRNDALHVATVLKLGSASVQPIDQSTQAVACPPPSPCTTKVVVTVGQDLTTL